MPASLYPSQRDFFASLTNPPLVIPTTLTSPGEKCFSIIVIPDTQEYVKGLDKSVKNSVFKAHIDWILESLTWQKIAFVSHVGDMVDSNEMVQWKEAHAQMSRLDGIVPYGISVGNHDMTGKGDSSLFQKFFPASKFTGLPWYGGYCLGDPTRPMASGNNANSFQLITQQGLDLLIMHLECNAPDYVLEWANEVMRYHSSRLAMITTHMDLGPEFPPNSSLDMFAAPKGRMRWKKNHGARGNSPQQMWEKCYRHHPNLRLVFCGDQRRTASFYQADVGDCGNVVHSILSDYSPLSRKHLLTLQKIMPPNQLPVRLEQWNPLRICRFYPEVGEVHVLTFDTTKHELIDGTPSAPNWKQHQFILKGVFDPVQTVSEESVA